MSLINQMLQDLEKRQSLGETRPLSAVRAVQRPRKRPFWRSLLLISLVLVGALAWLLWQRAAPTAVPEARPVAASVASVPAAPSPPPPQAVVEQPPSPSAQPSPPSPAVPGFADTRTAPSPDGLDEPPRGPAPRPAAPAAMATAPPGPTEVQAGIREVAPAAAVVVSKQMRESTPQQRAENEYRKALSLIQQGRIGEAVDGLGLALQLDAGHAAARQTLVGLLIEAGRYGEAERRLQEGLALDRAQPELAMTLARLMVERGDIQAAIATLERSQGYSERADYHAFLAALLQRQERHREAIEHYRLALRQKPSAVWQMGLGVSLVAENRVQEAREAFARAKAANTLAPELQAFVDQQLRQLGP